MSGAILFTHECRLISAAKLQTQHLYDGNPQLSIRVSDSSGVCLGDVGGQKTLRSYWRNYFEKTDALIWVVDATDRLRLEDCREELAGLLLEEVGLPGISTLSLYTKVEKRLMGASLLVFSNKTDVEGCMSDDEIRYVNDL